MQYNPTMTSKGQVTIPVAIRRRLNLKPGQPVHFNVSSSSVKIENNDWRKDLEKLQERVRAHMKSKNLQFPGSEDWQKVREQAWDDAAEHRTSSSEKS